MKKTTISILVITWIFLGLTAAIPAAEGPEPPSQAREKVVTKTYFLNHISPKAVKASLEIYFYAASYEPGKNFITIRIPESRLATFEALLKKLDVAKPTITFRIFTVIASKEGTTGAVSNADLRMVLTQLQKLLDYKSFTLDGTSLLTMKDGTRRSEILLSSSIESLYLELKHVSVAQAESGLKMVNIQDLAVYQPHGNRSRVYIRTQTAIKENGYLVAGVSKMGENGKALVLVINAEID